MTVSLRDYQSKQVGELADRVKSGCRRVLLQSPTGSGKSVIFSHIIAKCEEKGKRALLIVHRRELLFQAEEHLGRLGIRCGIIMSGEEYYAGCPVRIATIQTLYSRRKKLDLSDTSLVVCDEAHRWAAMSYQKIAQLLPEGTLVIGFTATPIRQGGDGLGGCFDALIQGPAVKLLIEQGYLADTEYMCPTIPDLREVKTRGGDYSEKGLHEKAVPVLIGGVRNHYEKYAGKKTIIFTCGKKHSQFLLKEFTGAGIDARVVDSDSELDDRQVSEKWFRKSERAVLINCGIYTEGIDVPDCDTIILARPTKSLGLYLQMVGRGMRPKGGDKLLVIDHGANVHRHGLIEDERNWELEPSITREEKAKQISKRIKELHPCKACGTVFRGKECPTCQLSRTYTTFAQNVREFRKCGLVLIEKSEVKRRPQVKKDAEIVTPRKAWIRFIGYSAGKGSKVGLAVHLFKSRFGRLPWMDKEVKPLLNGIDWKSTAKKEYERIKEIYGR